MTTRRFVWLAMVAAGVCFAPGCSKSRASTPAPAADNTEPPRMLSRGSFPELSIRSPNAADRPVVRISIRVLIDPFGRPDLKTLKVIGIGGPENQMAIERWIESATFRPAMRNGQAVSGTYETRLEVRVTGRSL